MNSCNVILKEDQKSLDIELQMYGHVKCSSEWGEVDYAPYHRLYYVHGGQGFCKIDGHVYHLKPKHLYLFPVNTTYEIGHNIEQPLECTYLHLYIMPLILNGLEEIEIIGGSFLEHHLKSLQHLITENHSYSTLLMHAAVLVDILSYQVEFDYMSNQLVLESIEMIQGNYSKKLTNTMLAEHFGYNTNYYIRVFTKSMGVSPGVYVAKYRLRMSIRLILSGSSIKDVARAVGYEDSKAFARFFKKQTGVAPSDYKKYYVLSI